MEVLVLSCSDTVAPWQHLNDTLHNQFDNARRTIPMYGISAVGNRTKLRL